MDPLFSKSSRSLSQHKGLFFFGCSGRGHALLPAIPISATTSERIVKKKAGHHYPSFEGRHCHPAWRIHRAQEPESPGEMPMRTLSASRYGRAKTLGHKLLHELADNLLAVVVTIRRSHICMLRSSLSVSMRSTSPNFHAQDPARFRISA